MRYRTPNLKLTEMSLHISVVMLKISDLIFTHFGVGTSEVSNRNFMDHSA